MTEATPLDLSQELALAQQAARATGAYLRERLGTAQALKYKAARDAQLDVDLAAEKLLLDAIHAAFPDDAILSEEMTSAPEHGRRLWIVDPLDGSFNFQHTSPGFGIAIALQIDGTTKLGVIYLPVADEMYTAVQGQGAYCNGAALSVSQTSRLSEALVHVSDFSISGHQEDNQQRLLVMSGLATAAGRVRMIGTAAGDFAWLASGKTDGVIMYSTHPWDVEAAALLVAEAGGTVTRELMPDGETPLYVSGNPRLQPELAALVRAPQQPEDDANRSR